MTLKRSIGEAMSPTSPPASASESFEQLKSSRLAKRQRLHGEQDVSHDLYQTVVTIRVGPDLYPFYMYEELLCHDSTFFKAAFEGHFKEGKEQAVNLPEDDVERFKIYQTWLNTLQLRYNFDSDEWFLCFAKLWIFADKIGSPSLKNKTVDSLVDTIKHEPQLDWPSVEAATLPMTTLPKTRPYDPLCIDRPYLHARKQPHLRELHLYPRLFVAKLANLLMQHSQSCSKRDIYEKQDKWTTGDIPYHRECSAKCCNKIQSSHAP